MTNADDPKIRHGGQKSIFCEDFFVKQDSEKYRVIFLESEIIKNRFNQREYNARD